MKIGFFAVLCLISVDVLAQEPAVVASGASQLVNVKSDEPTEVLADETEWNRNTNQVIARGNACIKQGQSIVKADEITGYFCEVEGQRRLEKAIAQGPGGVHITHGDKIMTSDHLTTYFSDIDGKRQLTKADALGNVHITSPTQTGIGDKATYDTKEDTAVLEGNVTLTQDENRMKGDWAKANFLTGQNILRADKTRGGQVQGLLFPKKASNKEKAT